MNSDFQVVALAPDAFGHFFSMSETELAAHGARRLTVDANPGYPCRISLIDAAIGERVILAPFKHHDVDSPYQASGPIFVRETAAQAQLAVNEIPLLLQHRRLSVRAYDKAGMMKASRVIEGTTLQQAIIELFGDAKISYLHLHNAGPCCFNCAVQRA